MAEHAGIALREMLGVGAVGIGEGVKRQALRGAFEQRRDARHFAGEDPIPSFQKLGVRYFDLEQTAQRGEKFGIADLAPLMALIEFVAPGKSTREMRRLAARVTGPAGDDLAEIDIEHHAAEIEQQRVGSAGGEQGTGHRLNTGTARSPAAGTR